jgi:hypothetical protein
MISRRIGSKVAVMAGFLVLAIFFFPSTKGSYSAVHGPVTALQAARSAARLRVAIVQGVLNCLGNCPISPLVVLSWMSRSNTGFQSFSPPACNTILRC